MGKSEDATNQQDGSKSAEQLSKDNSGLHEGLCRINKPLLPLKTSLFLYYGGEGCFMAYFTVYLKKKGLSATHLAILYTVCPFVQCANQMLAAIISDRTGKCKLILLINIFVGAFFLNGLLFLPHLRETRCFPNSCFSSNSSGVNCTSCSSVQNIPDCCYNTKEPMNFCLNSVDCINDVKNIEVDISSRPSTTVVVVAIIFGICVSTCFNTVFRCFDVIVMQMVKDFGSDFGKQRFWSILGMAVFPALAGYIIQMYPTQGYTDGSIAIYIFDVSMVVVVVLSGQLDFNAKSENKKRMSTFWLFINNLDVVVFYAVLLIAGSFYYFFRIFSSYYLDDLGATGLVIGLLATVSNIGGLPISLASNWCMSKITARWVLLLTLLTYCLQFFFYSVMVNPWWSLLIETGMTITYHLMWVAIVPYAHKIAPEGLVSVVIVSAGTIHFTIGKGTGSALGGFILDKYGGRFAFQMMSVLAAVSAVTYAAYLVCSHLRRTKNGNYEL